MRARPRSQVLGPLGALVVGAALSSWLTPAPAAWAQQPSPPPAPGAPPAAPSAEPAAPPPKSTPAIGEISTVIPGKLPGSGPAPAPKPAAQKAWKPKVKRVGPVCSSPSFQVLPNGTTRITLTVDGKVPIAEDSSAPPEPKAKKAAAKPAKDAKVAEAPPAFRRTYRVKGAQQPVRTSRMALPTTFFETSVERVQLVDDGADVLLVVELRQATNVIKKITEREAGVVLTLEVPKPQKVTETEAAKPAPAR